MRLASSHMQLTQLDGAATVDNNAPMAGCGVGPRSDSRGMNDWVSETV